MRARQNRARIVAEKGFLTVSWQAVKWSTTQVPPGLVKLAARAVLDVYAEAADEHGRQSYQSHVTVAWRLGCTVRNVSDHVEALRSAGLLVKSDDQSAVAHLPADTRPVVYDLPLHWIRKDTLDDFREGERERRRQYRKPKTGSAEASERYEENFHTGMQNSSCRNGDRYEENFHTGMQFSSPRHEENFATGTKKTSDKPSFEPPMNHPSSSATASAAMSPPTTKRKPKGEPQRDDVDELCTRLRRHVIDNGNTPPTITDAWRREARLLLDRDGPEHRGVPLQKALNVLDWCQQDSFWSGNIRSMPKFRKQYDTLRAQALREYERRKPRGQKSVTGEARAESTRAMTAQVLQEI
ncbi:hypothetical protein [Nocardia beijingensis]|uniref:hypothetical protein n=1 Tax=Nocardia beijingensis TaxID=95162 RepID=UPI00339E7806